MLICYYVLISVRLYSADLQLSFALVCSGYVLPFMPNITVDCDHNCVQVHYSILPSIGFYMVAVASVKNR